MRQLHLSKEHRIFMIAAVVTAVCISGCASLEQAQQRRQEKIRQQQSKRYLTLARPDVQISASPDGLEIGSDHYTLTFHEDLLENTNFDESAEREEYGRGRWCIWKVCIPSSRSYSALIRRSAVSGLYSMKSIKA